MSKILLTYPGNKDEIPYQYELVAIPSSFTGPSHEWRTKKLKASLINGIIVGKIRIAGTNTQNLTFQVELNAVDVNNNLVAQVVGNANTPIISNVETIYSINVAAPGVQVPEGGFVKLKFYWAALYGATLPNSDARMYYGALSPNITGDSYFEFPQPLFEYEPPPNEFRANARLKIGSPFVLNNLATNGSRVTSTRV